MIETGRVTAPLHLRAKPDDNSEILGTVPMGTIIHIDGREGNWLRASYNFKRGYLYKSYVEVLTIQEGEPFPLSYKLTIAGLVAFLVAALGTFFLLR